MHELPVIRQSGGKMKIEKGIPQTPGQVAYEAWRDRRDHFRETESWVRLRAAEQDMWEDIARVVIDDYKTNVVIPHPELCERHAGFQEPIADTPNRVPPYVE